jgi:hypothetical protein
MPEAQSWFRSLARSGQSDFYEASDWATAVAAAQAYDIFLRTYNASVFGSFVRLSERLGVTVIDRKRSRIELDDPEPQDEDEDAADEAVQGWQARLRIVQLWRTTFLMSSEENTGNGQVAELPFTGLRVKPERQASTRRAIASSTRPALWALCTT